MPASQFSLFYVDRESEQQAVEDAQLRGYLGGMVVETDDGVFYPVYFYALGQLKADLQQGAANGCPFIAEPAMIVVPEITQATMQAAVHRLYKWGYFRYLAPMTMEQLRAHKGAWPPGYAGVRL